MKHIGTPVIRLTPQSIVRSFWGSEKRHLFITGARGSGKSVMAEALSKLLAGEGMGMPGITTSVIPQDGIFLEENTSGRRTRIGVYAPPELERGHEVSCQPFAAEGDAGSCLCPAPLKEAGCHMRPVAEGLAGLGKEALERCAALAMRNGCAWMNSAMLRQAACLSAMRYVPCYKKTGAGSAARPEYAVFG